MSATNIEWTDRVWNPVTGCTKVSPGCKHCYAETVANRFFASQYRPVLTDSGKSLDTISTSHHEDYLANGFARPRRFTDVQTHDNRLTEPLRWRKPQKVFVNSMSDLFHEDVPDEFIDRVFAVMALATRHTFQILTKRAGRMNAYLSAPLRAQSVRLEREWMMQSIEAEWSKAELLTAYARPGREWDALDDAWPLPNVWLGVSCEDQQRADERIPLLLQTPAALRFISAEPLLGPVEVFGYLRRSLRAAPGVVPDLPALDWVIVGGESGPSSRPCDLAWVRSIVQQCRAASAPCFVKQLGARPVITPAEIKRLGWGGLRIDDEGQIHLRDRKGSDMATWPEDLRVREWPLVEGRP